MPSSISVSGRSPNSSCAPMASAVAAGLGQPGVLVAADRAAAQGQDREPVAAAAVVEQRAAAADLDVVGVRADGQHPLARAGRSEFSPERRPASNAGRVGRVDHVGDAGPDGADQHVRVAVAVRVGELEPGRRRAAVPGADPLDGVVAVEHVRPDQQEHERRRLAGRGAGLLGTGEHGRDADGIQAGDDLRVRGPPDDDCRLGRPVPQHGHAGQFGGQVGRHRADGGLDRLRTPTAATFATARQGHHRRGVVMRSHRDQPGGRELESSPASRSQPNITQRPQRS